MRTTLLDVGGSFIKCADGRKIPVPSMGSREGIAAALREAVGSPLEDGTDGVGVAIPGPFDYRRGIFLMKHKYPAVYGERFAGLAGIPEGVPVRFMHDVNAPLAGAVRRTGIRDASLVSLGTGLGFSYALGGEVKENENGSPLLSLWNRPWNGGILEDGVSARAIAGGYAGKTGKPALTARDIALLADAGDPAAREVYAETGARLGEALRPDLAEMGIRMLWMGGQISAALHHMAGPLQDALEGVSIAPVPEGAVFEGLSTLFAQ